MKMIYKGLVYNTENKDYEIIAKYEHLNHKHIIYRATNGQYLTYEWTILNTDIPTPPHEKLGVLSDKEAEETLNNFRGEVYWDKFTEV